MTNYILGFIVLVYRGILDNIITIYILWTSMNIIHQAVEKVSKTEETYS